jgi:hypothetical protein
MPSRLIPGLLLVELLTIASPAPAEVSINVNIGPPPPIVVTAPPPVVVVPAVPLVQYVPTLRADVFRFDTDWYYWHGGHWFVAPSYQGPWTHVLVSKLPRPIRLVPAQYYKIPPGHLKKMAGPPGHAKGRGKGHD